MSYDEIQALPIASIAADNSVLFLWATQASLPYSFGILGAWGFRYQRTITWDKQNGMCLFGFHHRTEFCLFGYRGTLEAWPKRKAVPTCFAAKSERHSAKPSEFYDMVSVFGSPRLDVFARIERGGWDVFGNEVSSSIELGAQNIMESGSTAYNRPSATLKRSHVGRTVVCKIFNRQKNEDEKGWVTDGQ